MDLDGLLLDAVAREGARRAARERSGVRALRQAAAEEATLAGTLVDLAERREVVVVRTSSGRSHRGVVAAVGRDFAVVVTGEAHGSRVAFVPLGAVTSLRAAGAGGLGDGGSRAAPVEASLAAVLAGVAAERPRVQVAAAGEHEPITGELRWGGADVLVVATDGGAEALVPLAAITDVVLLDSAG